MHKAKKRFFEINIAPKLIFIVKKRKKDKAK